MSSLFTLCLKLYISVCFAIFVTKSTITGATSVVLKLIHSDLVSNSHDNPNATLLEQVRRVEYSSIARYNYLNTRNIQTSEKYDDIQSRLMPDTFASGFFVNFSIGEPSVSLTVHIDTGSNLLWVPCYPCTNCSSHSNPTYDPAKSSTYSNISCDSQYCHGFFVSCTSTRTCAYEVRYADKSSSSGLLAKEQLKFSTSDDGITTIPNLVFGCGHKNFGESLENGILGLGAGPLSLVSQLGYNFSYCIGSIRDINYEYNHLVIGKDANLDGYSTPIKTYNGLYYLTLEGISVGDKRLEIDPRVFVKESVWDNRGVIIDSGSTQSYLARTAYNPFIAEVQNLIGEQLQKVTISSDRERLCYMGNANKELKGFPVVTFHFAGEADFVVDEEGIFQQYPRGFFCLAVNPVEDSEVNIIGITAQQYYNFGFDIRHMTLSFQRIDCELLVD